MQTVNLPAHTLTESSFCPFHHRWRADCKEVGIHSVAEVAKAMGIKTPLEEDSCLSLEHPTCHCSEMVRCVRHSVLNDRYGARSGTGYTQLKTEWPCVYKHTPKTGARRSIQTAFLMTEMLKAGLTEPMGNLQALWVF